MRVGQVLMLSAGLLLTTLCFGITQGQEPSQTPSPSPSPTRLECSVPIFKTGELERKAKILSFPKLDFSEGELHKYGGYYIVLRGVLCGSGKVTDLRVVRGLSDSMNEAAIMTAKKIKFRPAQKGGQNVSQWMQFEYRIAEP